MAQAAKEAFKICQGSVIIEALLYQTLKQIFIQSLDDTTYLEYYVNDAGQIIN